jgi:hypothetical protein
MKIENSSATRCCFFCIGFEKLFQNGRNNKCYFQQAKVGVGKNFVRIKSSRNKFGKIKECGDYHIIDFDTFMRFLKKELPRGWRDLFERYSKTRKSLLY